MEGHLVKSLFLFNDLSLSQALDYFQGTFLLIYCLKDLNGLYLGVTASFFQKFNYFLFIHFSYQIQTYNLNFLLIILFILKLLL